MLLELIDGLTAQITRLDEKVTAALAAIPGIAPAVHWLRRDRRHARARLCQRR